jgi:5-methylcytosine-specific restriction endonuclease McrA
MSRTTQWLRDAWAELILLRGGACEECGTFLGLEFAHVKKTKVNGMGRGKWRRYYDVVRHPRSYRLLCSRCHDRMDGRKARQRQADLPKWWRLGY